MKKLGTLFLCLLFVQFASYGQENERILKGKVTDGTNPIENVTVAIQDKTSTTKTDVEGYYQINVATGDVVTYTYMAMKTVTIKIEDVTRILNPVMVPDITELDEVVVEASKRRSQKDMEEDYTVNKRIIRTAWGYLDADRAAGNIRMLSEEEISPVSLCILDVIRSRFPGVRVIGSCTTGGNTTDTGVGSGGSLQVGGYVIIRGLASLTGSTAAIFDVDGQIFTDTPVWIDVNNIKRIAILYNLATTATYGNLGRGGVIVINTIGGNPQNGEIVDLARLKNNFLKSKVLTKSEVAANTPQYMKELQASTSVEEAKKVYEKYNNQYGSSPYFFIDASNYFHDTMKDVSFADEIIDNNLGAFKGNAVLLKALAYNYEEQGRFKKANKAYKDAFILRPNYAQSYLDMANSYRDINEIKQAASLYARYEYLIQEGFLERDTVGFEPIISREYNNLLMLKKGAVVKGNKSKNLYIADEGFEGTRLVFEWNDSEAEFDLQFVNPGNQYHTWNHSLADNSDTITLEKEFGYNTTEYLLDGSLPGQWKINVNYLGNKSLTPTYLKATIYHNYGSKAQRKEVKVFKLSLKNVNHELFKLQSNSSVLTN